MRDAAYGVTDIGRP